MKLYKYEGAVLNQHNKLIQERWRAYTWAPSERKARSNLAFNYNQQSGFGPHRRLYLPGSLVEVEPKQKLNDGEQLSFFNEIGM